MSLEVIVWDVDANPERLGVHVYAREFNSIFLFPLETKYFFDNSDFEPDEKVDYLRDPVPRNVTYRESLITYLTSIHVKLSPETETEGFLGE